MDARILSAAWRRFALDGYARMTIGDVARDAGVTRPTVYRRWPNKRDLVIDALDDAYSRQTASELPFDVEGMSAQEAIVAAVRRLDPLSTDNLRMQLIGNVLAEAERNPELLALIRHHAVEPRRAALIETLHVLQLGGRVAGRADIDAIADLCIGSYFAAYLRHGDIEADHAARVVENLWPILAPP